MMPSLNAKRSSLFKYISILCLLSYISIKDNLNAQSLNRHKWKDRIIVVIANNELSECYHKQVSLFKNDVNGLSERSLVLYEVVPTRYKFTDFKSSVNSRPWMKSSQLYQKYRGKKEDCRVLLIGLDGGIKLQQNEILSIETLFDTVDGMPMRQAQIRKQ